MKKTEPIIVLFYIIVFTVALFCFMPFWLIAVGSLSSEIDIVTAGYSLWPANFSTEAYKAVFQVPDRIINSYKVTFMITALGTFIGLLLTTLASYTLLRKDFKYRNKIAMFLYFPSLFSGGLLPFYILMVKYLGLKDDYLALILPGMISAWNIFLLRNFMSDIPDSLAESAKLDGANDFQIFHRIYLPLSKAGLATIGLFMALGYWNNWSNTMLYITKAAMYPLQYLLYSMLSNTQGLRDLAAAAGVAMPQMPGETFKMAMAIVTAGPILLLYPFVQRYFVKGLTVGAVKG